MTESSDFLRASFGKTFGLEGVAEVVLSENLLDGEIDGVVLLHHDGADAAGAVQDVVDEVCLRDAVSSGGHSDVVADFRNLGVGSVHGEGSKGLLEGGVVDHSTESFGRKLQPGGVGPLALKVVVLASSEVVLVLVKWVELSLDMMVPVVVHVHAASNSVEWVLHLKGRKTSPLGNVVADDVLVPL